MRSMLPYALFGSMVACTVEGKTENRKYWKAQDNNPYVGVIYEKHSAAQANFFLGNPEKLIILFKFENVTLCNDLADGTRLIPININETAIPMYVDCHHGHVELNVTDDTEDTDFIYKEFFDKRWVHVASDEININFAFSALGFQRITKHLMALELAEMGY